MQTDCATICRLICQLLHNCTENHCTRWIICIQLELHCAMTTLRKLQIIQHYPESHFRHILQNTCITSSTEKHHTNNTGWCRKTNFRGLRPSRLMYDMALVLNSLFIDSFTISLMVWSPMRASKFICTFIKYTYNYYKNKSNLSA